MERSSPSIFFGEKFRSVFRRGEQIDSVKLEQARASLRMHNEISRKTMIIPYARVANLRPRG